MNRIAFRDRQICRWNPAAGFDLDGQPIYVVGINYVARHVCTNFWEDWRPEIIAADLERIAVSGLNAVRVPIHWEYAEPAPGQFRPEMFSRFSTFLDMARERGLFVMPWFLVGVATQDYDVSWRNRESFFSERMTDLAARHITAFVKRFRDSSNILCWDICDEPEWYSRHPGADQLPYDTDRFHQWLERLYRAIKDADPQRAVTLGFGHIATGQYGMDIRRAAGTLDVMTVTAYPPHNNEDLIHGFRSTWFLGWSARMNDCAGKGIFTCEAPGWSDIEASEEHIGAYYRVCLFSNLANGSQGVMPWVWNDFNDAIQHLPPMDKYTIEKRFGIIREDGQLKPAGEELCRFARFTDEFPPSEWMSVMPEVGVLVPAQNPSSAHQEFSLLFHHYVFLRQAGLRVRYVWADDLDDYKGKLLFLPDSAGVPLLTGTWLKLKTWVERGGTLVSTSRHTSSIFNALFGVVVEGRVNVIDDVVMQDCQDMFSSCEGLVLPHGGSYLQVRSAGADVLSRDKDGRPLATRHALGKGQAYFMAYPPEAALAGIRPEALGCHGIHAFFRGVAQAVGLSCPIACPDPRIELDVRRHAGGRLLAILINHSRFPAVTSLRYEQTGTEKPVELPGNGVLW
ncbi:MAG: cellulase family glycosylhydrolase, partial [Verrucomicrobia bacterium]|nr:cellulase family glycosylhydrolase [Verrucomicrobiota bacterium]